jgi:hypothetical protein
MADFDDMNLWDAEVEYDPEAELNQQNLIPDDVKPLIAWKLGQRGFVGPKKDKNGKAYFQVSLQGNAVAPGTYYDNLALFDDPTSIVFEGGTSRIHAWLKSVGQAAPGRCSLGELKARIETALNGGAQGRVRIQWQGSVQDGTNETTGKNKYKVVVKGMKKFPPRPDGTHTTSAMVDGVEVNAQVKVMDYLAAAEPTGGEDVPF